MPTSPPSSRGEGAPAWHPHHPHHHQLQQHQQQQQQQQQQRRQQQRPRARGAERHRCRCGRRLAHGVLRRPGRPAGGRRPRINQRGPSRSRSP
eukprot:scaffold579_cov546-Prasinococcus_capsulatus_cf.AAC.2